MIEILQYTAGIMFWALANLVLIVVWVCIIAEVIDKMFGRKHD